ncbi:MULTISPECIES: enoyl-CoA hydratase/isomerase family protein [Protofrankia]|uniref:enoyl-CoA hydratase n=1 Tax=Candidatus Protofrankia datiscae TaxID=2716812 RepID=F8B548_9ACTN|nr:MULTISPECIES: enoyl-CoA hydratase-related protein [Protofrankia]AEH11071.1 Enoyl-CoA hydratase [Candidatus Protofrankia datiscae]
MAVVGFDVDGGVGTIRLDRPPMNVINSEVTAGLRAAADEATRRTDVRAVIIYGGPKVFAAGADVKEMAPLDHAEILTWVTELTTTFEAVARIPKPVVAAVTGYALGGGLELALTADFRVFGDNVKAGQPEILLGIIPGAGGTQRLPRLIGVAKAKDLIFTGRQVRATEAKEIGLADRLVAPDDVYTEARSLVARFVDGPAVALRAAKRAIDDGLDSGLSEGLRLETSLFAGLFGTQDRRIGLDSFVERGPGKADFVGR